MYICLGMALFFTLLWVNIMFTENINAKINPYQKTEQDAKDDRHRAVLKTISIILMSIFWSVVVYMFKS